MKIAGIIILCFVSMTVGAEGWGLGPINLGSTLKVSEEVLRAKSDFAGSCSIISLNSAQLPFYLKDYKSVELVFDGDDGNAQLVTIYLEVKPEYFSELKRAFNIASKKLTNATKKLWSIDENTLSIILRSKKPSC
jgi:hypothetical protein